MKEIVIVAVLLCLSNFSSATKASPKVQVYSRNPGEFGKANVLICHVSGFHPPEIRIELLKNDVEIPGSNQTDLAFEENWHYHLTRHVPFTPKEGDRFKCRVTHVDDTKIYEWEPDM
ncbi:beta-2-microglobulin [Nematolebias whitei]|uniref:beta-2-microglobulin n=1 Tax=Nematolebias whitei TaxID=451745 RepID=UPI00189AA04B|nr:beta-2-microglobulin [Nematolebias whitei]